MRSTWQWVLLAVLIIAIGIVQFIPG